MTNPHPSDPFCSPGAIGIPVAALLVVIGVAVWRLRRRTAKRAPEAGGRLEEAGSPVDGAPIAAMPQADPADQLSAIAQRVRTPDLNGFLTEIAGAIGNAPGSIGGEASDSFVEEMLDRLDDLRAILGKMTGDEAAAIGDFRRAIVGILADCGVETIHSEEWNPALQRAIARNPAPGVAAPTITDFGSTGYFRHGTLRRKQEVVLAIPSPDQKSPTQPET